MSTTTEDLPIPNEGQQQTCCVAADFDGDGFEDLATHYGRGVGEGRLEETLARHLLVLLRREERFRQSPLVAVDQAEAMGRVDRVGDLDHELDALAHAHVVALLVE